MFFGGIRMFIVEIHSHYMRLNLLETAATSAFKRLFMLVVVVIVIWLLGSHLLDLSR